MPGISKLGKYDIRREIGKGAMGVVYEGFDPFIERKVAIKTIRKSAVDKSGAAETFARFRREAMAAGRLAHSGIVSIYEYGETDDVAFIAMEYVQGRELKDYFDKREYFSIAGCLQVMLQILAVLDYSHGRNVVHRDIKPSNIMVAEDGQIKVADFGIAKIDASHLTHAEVLLGTPAYMSPEQFSGNAVDHRADLYSAGVILYQFLTGEKPFTGSVFSIMHKVQTEEPAPPSALNPEIPRELDEVLLKALAKQADDRYQTAMEFVVALKQAMAALPDTAMLPGPLAPGLPVAAVADEDTTRADIAHWKRISSSLELDNFQGYLARFPEGKFSELARRRLASMAAASSAFPQTEDTVALRTGTINRRPRQPKKPAREADAESPAREANPPQRGKAAVAASPSAAVDGDTILQRAWRAKVSEVRAEGARARAEEAAKRKEAEAERVRRKQELDVVMAARGKKLAAVLAEREAEAAAEKALQLEKKRKLEAEAQRKLREADAAKREIEFAEARERERSAGKRTG